MNTQVERFRVELAIRGEKGSVETHAIFERKREVSAVQRWRVVYSHAGATFEVSGTKLTTCWSELRHQVAAASRRIEGWYGVPEAVLEALNTVDAASVR